MKRVLSVLLLISVLLSSFTFTAIAADEVIITTSDSLCRFSGKGWSESKNTSVAGPEDGTSWYNSEKEATVIYDASDLEPGNYGVYIYMTPWGTTADKVDVIITASGKTTGLVTDGMHGGIGNRHWLFLGKYYFDGSADDKVFQRINADASAGTMRASGVKFVKNDTNTETVETVPGATASTEPALIETIVTTADEYCRLEGSWMESANESVAGPKGGTSWYTNKKEAKAFYDASFLDPGSYGVYLYISHWGTTADLVDVTISASGKSNTLLTSGTHGYKGKGHWIFLGKHSFTGAEGEGIIQQINSEASDGYMRTSGVKFTKDDTNKAEPDIKEVNTTTDERGYITVPENGSVVIGTSHPNFSKAGNWTLSGLQMPTKDTAFYTTEKGASGMWYPNINKADNVEIFYFKNPASDTEDTALEIEIFTEGTAKKVSLDLSQLPIEWCSLGRYNFSGNGDEYVKVTKVADDGFARITCLKFALNDDSASYIDKSSAFFDTDLHILERMGMLIGEGDGITEEYIKKTPTRVQAAIMVLRLNGVDKEAAEFTGTDNFADANLEPWAMPYLAYLKAHPEFGLIGTGNNIFDPTAKIDEQAYAKILLTALGYEYNVDFTWNETLSFAESKGIAKAESDAFTVKDLAIMTVSALNANCKNGGTLLSKLVLARDSVKDEGAYGTVLPTELKVARDTAKNKKRGIIYNNDGNDAYVPYDNYPGTFDITGLDEKTINTENFLSKRSYGLEDTQVGTVFYCTGVFNSYTHESSGITDTRVRDWSRALKQYTGKDSLETMADYVHSLGKDIFWSMRMNDIHDYIYEEDELDPWKQANMNLLMYRKNEQFLMTYSRSAWSAVDYTKMPVRQLVYDILKDTLTRYDIDGLDLDFSREPVFFKEITQGYSIYPENLERMNNLIRMIRDLTEQISIERGKPILVSIYVPDSIGLCKSIGLDVETWLKEDLVDIVSIGCHNGICQTWEDAVKEYNDYDVQVYAALDALYYVDSKDDYYVDKNEAALAYAAGADGIYTYNYFDINHARFDTLGSPETVGSVDPNYKSNLKLYKGGLARDTMKFVTR